MLLSISPIFIKKLILNIFMTNLSLVTNAQVHDKTNPKPDPKPTSTKVMKQEEIEFQFKWQDKWPTETELDVCTLRKDKAQSL